MAEVRLESSAVVEEGLLNPDDWVYRFSVPADASVQLGTTDQRLEALLPIIQFRRQQPPAGQAGHDHYLMVIGGGVRARAALAGVALTVTTTPQLLGPVLVEVEPEASDQGAGEAAAR